MINRIILHPHFLLTISAIILVAAVFQGVRLIIKRMAQRRIWPGSATARGGMNEREVVRHIRKTAQDHVTGGRSRSVAIRGVHWTIYFSLLHIRYRLSHVPADIIAMIPASLWLFDNYYLLYRELKKFQDTGGERRFNRLPVITGGSAKGFPRVYALAREMINCSSRHISEDLLCRMLTEYQKVHPLTIAELWTFQNVLSLCLLEGLIIEAGKIIKIIEKKRFAEAKIKQIISLITQDGKHVEDILKTIISEEQAKDNVFLAHLVLRLRTMSVEDARIDSWLQTISWPDSRLQAGRLADILSRESQFEAEAETDISTLIGSLKAVSDLNWENIFIRVSTVDAVLSKDPADIYGFMDSESKAQYRRVIEKLSRHFRINEPDVAEKVLQAAKDCKDPGKSHIGDYLVGKKRYDVMNQLSGSRYGVRQKKRDQLFRIVRSFFYFFSCLLLTGGILFAGRYLLISQAGPGRPAMVLLLICLIIPASDLSISLTNFIFSSLVKPKPLLALDFTAQIPETCRTFVVMPVIINNSSQIRSYVNRLEKHYLANRQDNLYFAILADYHDAPTETTDGDAEILSAGEDAVKAINIKYPSPMTRFYLFFRPRKWNPSQNCWMGWERKRGKLESFNAMLSGENKTGMSLVVGNGEVFPSIRYIITLDADTELLRDGASQLVGIMAHPLNKPVFDSTKNRITEGYAIIQSEIRSRISERSASVFARFFSSQAGIDPYATSVSDIYQDLFDEGIFAGKGIYDLRVFHQFMRGAIPENTVLSHDLLEGSLSRCAFANHIKLMDSCPASVAAFTKREHRWIRGDWQLLPWIFSSKSINGLSRWKMIDNLRRSLTRPALIFLIMANMILAPGFFWIWLIFAFFDPSFRMINLVMSAIWRKLLNPTARFAKIIIIEQLGAILAQSIIGIILLPYRAYMALDAIVRTLYRLAISHRNLLEWQTAESIELSTRNTPVNYWRLMWISIMPSAVLLAAAAVIHVTGAAAVIWLITAVFWLISPWVASLTSASNKNGGQSRQWLDTAWSDDLRLTARRIWRFFSEYATVDTHYLCPDNIQIQPGLKIAAKTSPTNIGLQLLALLSARDMGFVGLLELVDRCEKIVDTLLSLPKWQGHLYNWYNTRTLQVLHPRYVSTVDSGNFCTHLIALKQGLLEIKDTVPITPACIRGLLDTCQLAGWPREELPSILETVSDWIGFLQSVDRDIPPADSVDMEWLFIAQESCEALFRDVQKFHPEEDLSLQKTLREKAEAGLPEAIHYLNRIDVLASILDDIVQSVNFKALYDPAYQLFSIGYHVTSRTPDTGHYDLLVSEARVASYLAIAEGSVPQKHWFTLGRPLTLVRGIPTCVSWSGSVFEYMMPNLIMNAPHGSVLQQSCRAALLQHIAYARKYNIPWGISESQYYRFDTHSNFQYGPFGVQRLRLQANLKPAKVVAPYATMLALTMMPKQALENLSRLRSLGAEGKYGFYEALDYNLPDRVQLQPFSLVSSFMAHHQGMSLVAINNFFNQDIMRHRFHREPMIQSTELLLEEKRSSGVVTLASRGYAINIDAAEFTEESIESRVCSQTGREHPLVHVLSNSRYMVMLTSDGAGFSCCDNLHINRWQPDTVRNQNGTFIYLRSLSSNRKWSASYLPTQVQPEEYQVVFSHDKAEFIRRDGTIQTHTSITVSPVKNLEVRRVTLTNEGNAPDTIELTSYLEVVADDFVADQMHPAFSKLFIETEYIADRQLLIAGRRCRYPDEKMRYVMHAILPESKLSQPVEYETDRRNFIGRGQSLDHPAVFESGSPMSNRAGFSKDTILSLRAVISLAPGKSTSINFITGFFSDREDIMRTSHDLGMPYSAQDIFKLALTSSKLELKYLKINLRHLIATQNMLGYLFYLDKASEESTDAIRHLALDQSALWRFGISGDHPIILLRVSQMNELPIIQDILHAYEYLRIKLINVDLVILNEEAAGYLQPLDHRIREMTGNLKIFSQDQQKASLFLMHRAFMSDDEYNLLLAVSRIILNGKTGLYAHTPISQPDRPDLESAIPLPAGPGLSIPVDAGEEHISSYETSSLEFFNGIGGFSDNGRVYEIHLANGKKPPMPWINVIANDRFGFVVSETGAGYTWSGNSRDYKLTTWSNDPVLDPISEAIYIRDNFSGGITSPAALDATGQGSFRISHGFGYSVFEHREMDLDQTMTLFVPSKDPVKLWLLKLTNLSGEAKELTLSFYVEWVLGVARFQTISTIETAYDPECELFSAYNRYHNVYRDCPAFIFSSEPVVSFSGNRKVFFGQGGSIRYPSGLAQEKCNNETGVGLDPCAVIQISIRAEPGVENEILFGLGQAQSLKRAAQLARKYRQIVKAKAELSRIRQDWSKKLGNVMIRTPDRALDLLVNGWLQYQAISCRLRARTAFYQCSGAMGFRDQLQDVLALLDVDPDLVQRQILTCCARQFPEGDVQHWWFPDSGLGVRTRISDDYLWLPYVTAAYVQHTGSTDILDVEVPYVTGRLLQEDEAEAIMRPSATRQKASVYHHCLDAIRRASRKGEHGLPLMGGGDWNDGMNRVGIRGYGESVWLGWFLYAVLERFIPIVMLQGDELISRQLTDEANELLDHIERHAWDGEWYIRAFYDDGQPLGSKICDECRMDSISQSWAVLSGGAGRIRALTALDSARRYLVREEDSVSLLLTPPFDKTDHDPGYIKGYYPGIRENGGQYTHAAIWLAMAFAAVGKGYESGQLLNMLNPVHLTSTPASVSKYENEPYVMSADISMDAFHAGKAGWSWYTGSAGWMYQAIMNTYLGIFKQHDRLYIKPAVPASFKRYVVEYRYGSSLYEITVLNSQAAGEKHPRIQIDGKETEGNSVLLVDDGAVHNVVFKTRSR